MTNILGLSLTKLVSGIKKKDFTSEELTNSYIDNSKKAKKLNTFITTNFGEFHSQGLETSIDLDLPRDYSLSIHHTWNDHYLFEKTKSNHYQPGTRRPKHKLNANLSHNWDNGIESVVGLFIRGRAKGFDAANETPAFGTVRTALSYQYDKNIKLTARLENILDARALEVGGFGYPGRSGYVGFGYTFN